jgi:hypothetical protein
MAYADTAALLIDGPFQDRVQVVTFQEATKFSADDRPDIAALAEETLKVTAPGTLIKAIANSPGFDTKFADGGQEAITDGDLLSATDAVWPTVAALLYPAP